MELRDLEGEHMLTGVDIYTSVGDEPASISFILDDITYTATEDPQDGYRSSMKEISISKNVVKNTFRGCKVFAQFVDESCEILQIRDFYSKKVVIEVGTNNTDDYYPFFVSEFNPEKMTPYSTMRLREMVKRNGKKISQYSKDN